jgi:hypothetical protein
LLRLWFEHVTEAGLCYALSEVPASARRSVEGYGNG